MIHDAYHIDITDVNAMALQLLIPFFLFASVFRKKTSFTIFQELGAFTTSINRFWKFFVMMSV